MHARAWRLTAVSVLGFLFFFALRIVHPQWYLGLLTILIKVPVTYPFADWDWNAAAIRCWGKGINVYVENPCFDFWPHAVHNYSPLWLRLPFLGTEPAGSLVVALCMCAAFFLSLAALPPARSRGDQALMLLALFSSSTLLAVERGNTELLIFTLLVPAVRLVNRCLPWRLLGYALIGCVGLLKFYPLAAMWVALKERIALVFAVGLASVAAVAVLVFAWHDEIRLMAGNLPNPSYWILQFGAANLAVGVAITIGKVLEKVAHIGTDRAQDLARALAFWFQLALALAAIGVTVLLLMRSSLRERLHGIAALERDFMIVGGAILVGCHFAGQSVIYRGIFFLLVLPGLAAMAHASPARSGQRMMRLTSAAAVLVLWAPALDSILAWLGISEALRYQGDPYAIFPGTLAGYGLWLAKEIAWWWIMSMLMAVLAGTFLASDTWTTLREMVARMR